MGLLINRELGSYIETIVSIVDAPRGWVVSFASGDTKLITTMEVVAFVSAALDTSTREDERTHFDAQVILNSGELVGFTVRADLVNMKLRSGKIIPWVHWLPVQKELARA